MKYFLGIIAVFVAFFSVYIGAEAAKELVRGVPIAQVNGVNNETVKVYRVEDGKTSCYIVSSTYGPSISCVR